MAVRRTVLVIEEFSPFSPGSSCDDDAGRRFAVGNALLLFPLSQHLLRNLRGFGTVQVRADGSLQIGRTRLFHAGTVLRKFRGGRNRGFSCMS